MDHRIFLLCTPIVKCKASFRTVVVAAGPVIVSKHYMYKPIFLCKTENSCAKILKDPKQYES